MYQMILRIGRLLTVLFCLFFVLSPIMDQAEAGFGGWHWRPYCPSDGGGGGGGNSVPEPATILLLAAGGGIVYFVKRRKRK